MMDPVVRDTNRYHDEQFDYETWYEQNEADLADEFYEKYGVEAFDAKKWESFVESRWVSRMPEDSEDR